MPKPKVQKLRQKRQNLRTRRKGRGGGSEAKETSASHAGRDVATTSYLRTQGKAYAQGRTGSSAYKAGTAGKTGETKADTVGGRDRRKKVLNKKIRKVSKAIKKARS